jgi:rRNA maturation protein Nop10
LRDKPSRTRRWWPPLLELVRRHKEDVHYFLRCYCPKCGGVVFVGNKCFMCDWQPRPQDAEPRENGPSCGGCAHFTPSRLNPAQGFGRCGLVNLSKRPGAYPGKAACNHFEAPVGEEPLRGARLPMRL